LSAEKKKNTVFIPTIINLWQEKQNGIFVPYEIECIFGKSKNKIKMKNYPDAAVRLRDIIKNVSKTLDVKPKESDFLIQNISIPQGITVFPTPTKEFQEIQDFLKKHNIKIEVDDLWSANIYGKRGVFNQEGRRNYVAYDKELCNDILTWLKFYVGKIGILTAEIKEEDDVDPDEITDSRYREIECEGTRHRYLDMYVKRRNIVTHAMSYDPYILRILHKEL